MKEKKDSDSIKESNQDVIDLHEFVTKNLNANFNSFISEWSAKKGSSSGVRILTGGLFDFVQLHVKDKNLETVSSELEKFRKTNWNKTVNETEFRELIEPLFSLFKPPHGEILMDEEKLVSPFYKMILELDVFWENQYYTHRFAKLQYIIATEKAKDETKKLEKEMISLKKSLQDDKESFAQKLKIELDQETRKLKEENKKLKEENKGLKNTIKKQNEKIRLLRTFEKKLRKKEKKYQKKNTR